MTTYQYLENPRSPGNNRTDMIRIIRDGIISTIPNDLTNIDWIDYQAWLAADPVNNIPEPRD